MQPKNHGIYTAQLKEQEDTRKVRKKTKTPSEKNKMKSMATALISSKDKTSYVCALSIHVESFYGEAQLTEDALMRFFIEARGLMQKHRLIILRQTG